MRPFCWYDLALTSILLRHVTTCSGLSVTHRYKCSPNRCTPGKLMRPISLSANIWFQSWFTRDQAHACPTPTRGKVMVPAAARLWVKSHADEVRGRAAGPLCPRPIRRPTTTHRNSDRGRRHSRDNGHRVVVAPVIIRQVVMRETTLTLLVDSHGGGHPGSGWRRRARPRPAPLPFLSSRGSLAQCLDAAAPY
jgi:hypothetical protein